MSHRSRVVLDALTENNQHLKEAERAAKYNKMAQSAFRFYRGTNHLFWSDFASDQRLQQFSSEKTRIWLQGDLHSENYGAYHNDSGDIVYSLNDFDDAVVADYQFDLWRMAISIVLVARQNSYQTFKPHEIESLLDTFVESYLDSLSDYRGNRDEDQMVFQADELTKHLDEFLEDIGDRTSIKSFLDQWTERVPEAAKASPQKRRFRYARLPHKLTPATEQEWTAIAQSMEHYGTTLTGKIAYGGDHFQIQDIARRINAGTGSLGAQRYYVLIAAGSDHPNKGCILDIKHQTEPTPYCYMTEGDRQIYTQSFGQNHALRHSIAYRALTNKTDDYLGWMDLSELSASGPLYCSVRELSPYKRAFDTTNIARLKTFEAVAKNWGLILATAHARADKNFDETFIDYSFEKQIDRLTDGHHQDMRDLVKAIALPYADQVEADWQTFLHSVCDL